MGNCISGQRNSTPPIRPGTPDLPDNRPFVNLPEPQQTGSQRSRTSIDSRLSGLSASGLPNNTIPRLHSESLQPRSNRVDASQQQQQHPNVYSRLSEPPAQGASVDSANSLNGRGSDTGATVGSRNSSDAGATVGSRNNSDAGETFGTGSSKNGDYSDNVSSISSLDLGDEHRLATPFDRDMSELSALKKELVLQQKLREVNNRSNSPIPQYDVSHINPNNYKHG